MKARILYILLCGAMFFCSAPFGFASEASAGDEVNNRLSIDCEDSGRSSRLVQGQRRKPAAEDARARVDFRAEMFLVNGAGADGGGQVPAAGGFDLLMERDFGWSRDIFFVEAPPAVEIPKIIFEKTTSSGNLKIQI